MIEIHKLEIDKEKREIGSNYVNQIKLQEDLNDLKCIYSQNRLFFFAARNDGMLSFFDMDLKTKKFSDFKKVFVMKSAILQLEVLNPEDYFCLGKKEIKVLDLDKEKIVGGGELRSRMNLDHEQLKHCKLY